MDSCLVKNKDKLMKIDRLLLNSIIQCTDLNERDLKTMDIEVIEKKVGIKTRASKVFFDWENSEKDGWQNQKFVSEEELNNRELRMDEELKRL